MAAVIAFANGDAAWVEEGEGCVEGGEAGGVGDCFSIKEGREDGFEAGWIWAGDSRVDVVCGIDVGLHGKSEDKRCMIRELTMPLTM
jgi:hypothetical protein